MILRRIADGIRRQDWFMVVVEILIVVTGIFVGLQVSNWNEERVEHRSERRVLERLFEESQTASGYIKLILYRADRLQENREAAEARLRGEEPGVGDPEVGFATMSMFRAMTPLRSAYDQLTASGEITLVRSQEVRDAVTLYYGVLAFHDLMRREYVEGAPDILVLASEYTTVRYDPDAALGYEIRVDWDRAGADRALVNAVRRVMGDQLAFNERRRDVLEQSLAMCGLLGEALGRACEPPDFINDPVACRSAAIFVSKSTCEPPDDVNEPVAEDGGQ